MYTHRLRNARVRCLSPCHWSWTGSRLTPAPGRPHLFHNLPLPPPGFYTGGATENASTENESTGGWNMQVRKTQVRVCNGGKRKYKYSNLKSILKSLRFSSLAFSVDPLSLSRPVHLYCTRPVLYTRNRTHAGLMRRRARLQKSQTRRCRVTVLGKLFTLIVPGSLPPGL